MAKGTKLIRIAYLLGLIPLIGGLLIFFAWWIGKAVFLVTLHRLEGYGFIWILMSIPLGLGGLITAMVYLVQGFRENLVKGVGGLFSVLINIPALMWIVEKRADIEKRAYVRIYNQTENNFTALTIENSSSQGEYRSLDKENSKTTYFYPMYLNGDFDSVPLIDTVRLEITTADEVRTIVVPEIYKGECVSIIVHKEFDIETK